MKRIIIPSREMNVKKIIQSEMNEWGRFRVPVKAIRTGTTYGGLFSDT